MESSDWTLAPIMLLSPDDSEAGPGSPLLHLTSQTHIVLPETSDSQVLPVIPFIPGWGHICSVAIGLRVTLSPLPPWSPLAPKIFTTVSPLSQGTGSPVGSFHILPYPTLSCYRMLTGLALCSAMLAVTFIGMVAVMCHLTDAQNEQWKKSCSCPPLP